MLSYKILVAQLLVAVVCANHQTYPGTPTRPILSSTEASQYTKETYLQGWRPENINTDKYEYLVGNGGKFSTIQKAVNSAILTDGIARRYIKILPGTYRETVLIPKTNAPITIYGTPGNPGDVRIIFSLHANMTGDEYEAQVNPKGTKYFIGDPAYAMYSHCRRQTTIIGTTCSSIFRTLNDKLQVAYLTIENPATYQQAVALYASGDLQQYENIMIQGFQDTLYANHGRLYFANSVIKGDVDFVFGDASAVFESTLFIARGDRHNSATVFAPSSAATQKYGFLVVNCNIIGDGEVLLRKSCNLARKWTAGDETKNGQLVIRETNIADIVNVTAPYAASTDLRMYSGDANYRRNLDDPHYNRFWEYKNFGAGA